MDPVFDVDGFSGSSLRCAGDTRWLPSASQGGLFWKHSGAAWETHCSVDDADVKLGSVTGAAPLYQGSVTYGEKGVAARNVPQKSLSRDGEEMAGWEDHASEVRSSFWRFLDGGPGVRGSAL